MAPRGASSHAARLALVVGSAWAGAWSNWTTLADIPTDGARGRLSGNWAVTGAGCVDSMGVVGRELDEFRRGAVAGGGLAEELGVAGCEVVCLNVGAPVTLARAAARLRRSPSRAALKNWFARECLMAEVGWITYGPDAELFWRDPRSGDLVPQGSLRSGEEHTVWRTAGLGHVFVVKDARTAKEVKRYTVTHDAIHVVVPAPRPTLTHKRTRADMDARAQATLKKEEGRARNVRRTWTETGFAKGALPAGLWADMATFWHNNRHSLVYEEWADSQDAYVNWWDAPPSMCFLPFGLKGKWHDRLKDLVEAWLGGAVTLEKTDLYGIRSYPTGATLTPHVDRESTHAASVIVNIAQYGMEEPWALDIKNIKTGDYDAVSIHPGEILYYESAKCLHGRVKPLKGAAFASLFAHYRPLNDPHWFLRRNPAGEVPLAHDADAAARAGPYDLGDPLEQTGIAGVRVATRATPRSEL